MCVIYDGFRRSGRYFVNKLALQSVLIFRIIGHEVLLIEMDIGRSDN
jgi:hypothetical protein